MAWRGLDKLILSALLLACSASTATRIDEQGASADDGEDDDSQPIEDDDDASSGDEQDDSSDPPPVTEIVDTLPPGFTAGTTAGGFHIVGPLDTAEPRNDACVNVLRAVVRD